MAKVLIVASVASMVNNFLIPNIVLLKDIGYDVEVACNFETGSTCSQENVTILKQYLDSLDVVCHQIDFVRNVFDFRQNHCAYKQVRDILASKTYAFIHCHTPIGGFIGRIAGITLRTSGTKVLYTAHGFHFYKGAPLKNWLLYYPVEKICARFTDVLITINKEDYALASRKLKAKRVEYIPGVGIDLSKFDQITINKSVKRKEFGIPIGAKILLSVGELNENKNHETVIRAISEIENIYYFIAGKGELQVHLQSVIDELGVSNRVKLLGFRNDVDELCQVADIFVMPSLREGLSVALMEAMASGLPCVVSRIRGNIDLIDENGGVLFDPHSVNECKNAIQSVRFADSESMGNYNQKKIQGFSLKSVNEKLKRIVLREAFHN